VPRNEAPPDEGIAREYRKRRGRSFLIVLPSALLALLMILVGRASPDAGMLLVYALLLYTAVAVVLILKIWRCPHCRSYLGNAFNPRFCPSCGVRLRE
jgi:hypothetical protein